MIINIEPTDNGFTLTLQKKGGKTVLLAVPNTVLYDRPRLQRLAMAHGVRLRLNKYTTDMWREYLRDRFQIA